MQASGEKQICLLRSRLARRVLLCTLSVAICLFIAGYIMAVGAEKRARQEFLDSRRELVLERLLSMPDELYPASQQNQDSGFSPRLANELRQILLQGQFAYLVVLDPQGRSLASQSVMDERDIARFVDAAGAHSSLPYQELVSADGVEYLSIIQALPGAQGVRVLYGLSYAQLRSVGATMANSLQMPIWAGLGALFILCLFFLALFASPLLKLIKYSVERFGGQAPKPQAVAGRNDELGEFARFAGILLDRLKELELRPVLSVSAALQALEPFIEKLPHGLAVLEPDGSIVSCNLPARELLAGEDSNFPNIFPLAKKLLNHGQFSDFRARFDNLLDDCRPLEVVKEDSEGVRSFAIHVHHLGILGSDYVLCMFQNVSEDFRIRQVEARAKSMADRLIQERTEEILKINEQLRQENAERRAVEQALVRAESRYREIVNNSIEGIFQRTADGRMLSSNASMARILGYGSVEELLDAYSKPGMRICYTAEMELAINELLDIRGWVSNMEFQALMQDGSPVWVAMNARRVADSAGETLYYEAFIEDITSRKKTEEKLVYQAFHDPLTGLPNRALFLDRLRMALRRSKRRSEYLFAVLYLDLDRFKNINDSFGHSAGDKMLNHATEKLLQCVRDADTVARFGGDEFAVLLADLEKPSQAVVIAKRISAALSEPVSFHGQEVCIGASIGIVLNNHEYGTPEEILRDADTAMYRSKLQGRRGYTVFNERMREETMAALALESDLRGAVERGEIEAFYQPLVDIDSGKVHGFEALMRWRRNDVIISPVIFIPIAEETGLIYDLGLEMMKIVCTQMVDWTKSGQHNECMVHINISSKQLMATRFWRDVQEILNNTGVNPRQLIFEITESVFLDYGSQVISIMNMVRDFGIRFCLDDFGTGFSSLSYLRMLPLESLKVDRSFIVDINNDSYSEAILRNLISMGRDLGLKVITEGVAQLAQVEVLRSVGCKYAQGFYFAEPLPAPEAAVYILEHGCAEEA